MKWIAFVVSMMEIIVLARAMFDLWRALRTPSDPAFCAARGSFAAAKWWTCAVLFGAILISIPPLNAVIHGTYVVTGHAMGAMIGIDTMILLGAAIWILSEHLQAREGGDAWDKLHTSAMRWALIGLNFSVAALVLWLHVVGTAVGVTRAVHAPGETYVPPDWVSAWSGDRVRGLRDAVAGVLRLAARATHGARVPILPGLGGTSVNGARRMNGRLS